MNLQEKIVLEWIIDNGYAINTRDLKKLMKYIDDMEYIRTVDDIIQANIDYYNIKCPTNFLDVEEIINNDGDYIYFKNDTYLNVNWLMNDIDEGQIPYVYIEYDYINFDASIDEIAKDIIKKSEEYEWCNIEKEDIIETYLNPVANDIAERVLCYIDNYQGEKL